MRSLEPLAPNTFSFVSKGGDGNVGLIFTALDGSAQPTGPTATLGLAGAQPGADTCPDGTQFQASADPSISDTCVPCKTYIDCANQVRVTGRP